MNDTPLARPKLSAETKQLLLDSAIFQIFWFGSILSPNPALQLTALLLWAMVSRLSQQMWLGAVVLAALGIGADTMWINTGLFAPHDTYPGLMTVPLWLALLWVACARYLLLLATSLSLPNYGLFLLGAISGPLSYLAAAELGAASVGHTSLMIWLAFSLWWGGLMLLIRFLGGNS